MNAVPLVLTQGATISPNQRKVMTAELKVMDPELHKKPIQGDAITWVTTNKDGFPLVPVVSEYTANKTSIGFKNNSETMQSHQKGQVIGYLDLRSKDGSLTHIQWLIPMYHNLHDYILYSHTFASTIEKQPLAQEDIQKQLNNRFKLRKTPIKDTQDKNRDKDPYPWLDKDDPWRNLTNRQILKDKIKLQDSILTSEEKRKFLDMLETKRDAFSL